MGITEPAFRKNVANQGIAPHALDRFIRFLASGIVATSVDVGLLFVLTGYFGIWYLSSATASYCCGVLVSYWLNKTITFHDTRIAFFRQFFLFAVISGCSLLLNLLILYVLVNFFILNYLVAKGFAIGVTFLWNYVGQSQVTFRGD